MKRIFRRDFLKAGNKDRAGTFSLRNLARAGLGRTLLLSFLVISMLPLLFFSVYNYYNIKSALHRQIGQTMAAVAEIKAGQLEGIFKEMTDDLELSAHGISTRKMMEDFELSFAASGLDAAVFVKSPEWNMLRDYYGRESAKFIAVHGYKNLLLIDLQGNILFSVNDEENLGSNILNGRFSASSFGRACARLLKQGRTVFSGFEKYGLSGNEPAAFFVTYVREDAEKQPVGLLAFQLDISQIDRIMQVESGLGELGETYLVNSEGKMVSNSMLAETPTSLETKVNSPSLQHWFAEHVTSKESDIENNVKSTVHTEDRSIDLGDSYRSYRGRDAHSLYRPIDVLGVKVALIAEVDDTEIGAPIIKQRNISLLLAIAITVLVIFASLQITNRLAVPVMKLSGWAKRVAAGDLSQEKISAPENEIGEMAESFEQVVNSFQEIAVVARAIADGDFSRKVSVRSESDMLGRAINTMSETLLNIKKQAGSIAGGDYSVVIEPRGEKDELGLALQSMTKNLRQATAESMRQNWLQSGMNQLNDAMSGDQQLSELARSTITFLAKYLHAQVGALYILGETGQVLKLTGSYAFSKRQGLIDSFRIGEGLVGQAAFEKEIISVSNIPKDYIRVNSALGEAIPRNVLLAPILYEGGLTGVIELGTLGEFTDTEMKFLKMAIANIGIAVYTAQARTKMKELLDETRQQSEELLAQQEELRAANEELEEQTMALKESEARLKNQQEELQAINEELEEKTESLEKQKLDVQQKNDALELATREIEERANDLAVASKYKSQFLANMSHELRTPLNSMLLLSRLLAENRENNLNKDQKESAQIVYSSGQDLLTMINDILDLAKIEAGRMDVEIRQVELREMADGIMTGFKHVVKEKNLEFSVNLHKDIPAVINTDRKRLEQIIRNLLANALKFTEAGSIKVDFRPAEADAKLFRSGLNPLESLAVAVTDTGSGVPFDKQKEIFEAFQQADGSIARKHGGTGLGLSISRELAKLLGGEIMLRSAPGSGSTFILYIPFNFNKAARAAAPAIDRRKTAGVKAETTITIQPPMAAKPAEQLIPDDRENIGKDDRVLLVIEDDQNFAGIVLREGHKNGFKCIVAGSGEAGLAIAESERLDAIILDIKLPGIDGWAVLSALKDNPKTIHIPVHMMSVEEASLDAFRKGAIGFLSKPVEKELLDGAFARIKKVIEKDIKDLLVIEDDDKMRRGLVKLIGDSDIKVSEAASGKEALAAIKSASFDCVVLDLGLPDMSGFDLLKKFKEQGPKELPPIIVYTGRELSRAEEAELKEYAESIIVKGVKSEERLIDETAIFLHRVVDKMPAGKRQMIIDLHDRDAMFASKKVLVVDDDMRNVFALSRILKDKGVTVLKAEDGGKALEVLDSEPDTDMVLMDIMMPVMDGYETMRKIRAQQRFSNLPIIALTAKAMKEDRADCLAAGASDYLSKPVDIERLLSVMRVWLYR